MTYYFAIGMIIILFAYFGYTTNRERLFYIGTILILIFFAGFRGDFTEDYNSYSQFFEVINNEYSFKEIWTGNFYNEKGFIFLVKILGSIFNQPVFFMFFMSTVTIICFVREFQNSSKMFWLTILMFVSLGLYYDSFNISRQIMSSGIVFMGSKYLYDKKYWRYIVFVLFASLFHRTALFVIPFSFVLSLKVNKRNLSILAIIGIVAVVLLPRIVDIVQQNFGFYTGFTYGMGGGSWKALLLPLCLLLFCGYSFLLGKTELDINAKGNNVLINATVLYFLFILLGTQIQMVARLASFFQPYVYILVPNILYEYQNPKEEAVFLVYVTVLSILYPLITLSGTGYDPYYFIWR